MGKGITGTIVCNVICTLVIVAAIVGIACSAAFKVDLVVLSLMNSPHRSNPVRLVLGYLPTG
jgi:hypothetical protein